MLRDATQITLFEILGRSRIPHEYHKAENVLTMTDTRSRIIFRPLDDYERLRGTNLAWFGLDELTYTAEEAWLRLEGRLRDPRAKRLCGFAVWTPKGFDWVYRRFVENLVEGYEMTLAAPYENRYLLDKVPDYYDRLKRSYDGRFFEQEVLGKYLNVSEGQVYHTFERARNVVETSLDATLPLRWALDFNVDPMCSVIAQIRDGVVHVLDEMVLSRLSTPQVCEQFLEPVRPPPGRGGDLRGRVGIETTDDRVQRLRDDARGAFEQPHEVPGLPGPKGEPGSEGAGEPGERDAAIGGEQEPALHPPTMPGAGGRPGAGKLQARQFGNRKRPRPAADAPFRRTGVPGVAGMQAKGWQGARER